MSKWLGISIIGILVFLIQTTFWPSDTDEVSSEAIPSEQSGNTSFPVATSAQTTQSFRIPLKPGELTKWYTMPPGSIGVIEMEREGACVTILKNGDVSNGTVMCQGSPIPYEERRTVAFLNHTSKDEVVLLPNQ